ncbi:L,D-transpeptidase [Methylocystis sp. B8]|uniref:L,D-transpeptidase n=1 Tax=Methylocystis sp. B8 TaxID=544938 RepID=UPI0010FE012F|nr:L,D-transpeptidase [Methylocystis sp. B8]TLG75522.1 L,D-transpeptidase [Methylocystis sp. B8]
MRRPTLAVICAIGALCGLAAEAFARSPAPQPQPQPAAFDPFAALFGGGSFAPQTGDGRPQAVAIPREVVAFNASYAPGTVIIATNERRLYYTLGHGQAIRYGVGVGRPGFEWAGTRYVAHKREWPDWTPPSQMLRRRPDLPRHMVGGLNNPLGARAMYLSGTLYRIHGSNEPWTIGQAVSSGCIRMTNDDVVDLYNRVRVGTRVVVTR